MEKATKPVSIKASYEGKSHPKSMELAVRRSGDRLFLDFVQHLKLLGMSMQPNVNKSVILLLEGGQKITMTAGMMDMPQMNTGLASVEFVESFEVPAEDAAGLAGATVTAIRYAGAFYEFDATLKDPALVGAQVACVAK